MNQSELIAVVADRGSESNRVTGDILKAAGEVVAATLKAGGEVTLPGIGKLSVKTRAARAGRNPKTGEAIQIPAKRSVAFSAAKALRDAVNQ